MDVHKQVSGRKRPIVVDTLGLLRIGLVHTASIADGAYPGITAWVKKELGCRLEVVRRPEGTKGFMVLPRRWVVQRTFWGLGRYRRLARDCELQVLSSQTMVYAASVHCMLRLLTREN